jgi:glycosyltransferase involved in cell wall biosynthesis
MVEKLPKVSIGMPIYNGERYLRQALDAIAGQTFADFELVISDNASTDATGDICREYARRDSRIQYYSNEENRGASWNYNRVFELSRGKYFRWAPADDVFGPESLQHCVAVLDAYPEVVLCYPQTILIDANGSTIRSYADNLDLPSPSPVDRFRQAHERIGLVNVQYGLIRSDSLRQTARMGNYPGADVILVLELTLYGRFHEIPKAMFYRRMHESASSSIKTLGAVQEFYDPKTRGLLFLRSWTHQHQKLASILRAPISLGAKARLMAYVGRCTISMRHLLMEEVSAALRQTLLKH